ncbi:TenA family protein [Pseudonocardia humida]|uniref:Aminopyrimidine aminohydrolase n=1 Tax=Pseudonocardia humida TaxID=2800819 RepID=A0ABT1A5L3_9PSEU|nr:TenA family protein [Pseudonocardia humida]MCO1658315.1 TenA family protein [Pseudonocardia humida]
MTFSDELRTAAAKAWDAAATHRFVDELWAGRLEPGVFGAHLVQESLVLDPFVALMGATVAVCDLPESRLAHARRLGLVAGPPAAYLARAMDVLDVPLDERTHPEPRPATAQLRELLETVRSAVDHPSCLTVLLVGEWLRLDCATRSDADAPTDPLAREWVELRRGAAFEGWVAFLRLEFDRVSAALDDDRRDVLRALFVRTAELELAFLDGAYV